VVADNTSLHRTPVNRCFSGGVFQPVLTMLVVASVLALVSGSQRSPKAVIAVVATVLFVVWLFGVLGTAEVDVAGVRWRYYRPHTLAWGEIERVTLRSESYGINGVRHLVEVRTAGGRHRITPACGSRSAAVSDFAQQLVTHARARGVSVEIYNWGDRVR
jgi:hypothetical protein